MPILPVNGTISLQLVKEFNDGYESLTVAQRKEIDASDFAWPEERKYPINSQAHLDAAATLIGRAPADKQAEIKRNAIRIAKRHGFTLPQSWQDEKESASTHIGKNGSFQESNRPVEPVGHGRHTLAESARPQKKIGTLKICWLEYNARSLNGRIYPKATCDAIFKAAQETLSNPNALPPTTFISHEAANGNVNTELVGAPVRVWQEGAKFWANIDLADTSTARDMLGLVEGNYLKSGSMRVAGVELMHDRNYDVPLVVCQEGITPQFLGIDLTTRPGLADSARITQVLYESAGQQSMCIESFQIDNLSIENKEEEVTPPAMPIPIFIQVALGAFEEAMTSDRAAHQRIHDHLAGVMDSAVKECHGMESANFKALVESQLDESGRMIAKKHAVTIAAAHDEAAKACGMTCEGCYSNALGMANPDDQMDGDSDGDSPATGNDPDNDGESQKENKTLTEEEMIAALKAKGFAVETPKTPEQKKIEEQDAKIAALEAKFAQMNEGAPTQRQTQAPSQFEEASTLTPEVLYEQGDYLKGDLAPKNWRALANPAVPWPQDLEPALVLSELTPFLEYNLLNMQESSAGRSLREQIKLGLID